MTQPVPAAYGTLIDLTLPLYEGMIGHPSHGRSPVRLAGTLNHWMYKNQERKNPYNGEPLSFANEQWVINGNTGTHMDAPWHANPDPAVDLAELTLAYGFGSAVKLDVRQAAAGTKELTAADLASAEENSGESVQLGDIVLIQTGCSSMVEEDPEEYLYRYTGLHRDAGEWLRAKGVRTVGIDAPSVDSAGGGKGSPVHMNFLRPASLGLDPTDLIIIIENLINLDKIPVSRFLFVGLPLPLKGSSGSPIRALAVI